MIDIKEMRDDLWSAVEIKQIFMGLGKT
jgi:hypothetical protein